MGETERALSLPLIDYSEPGSSSNQNREQQCLQAARQIFSCYRRDDAADPDGYVASVAAVLSEYPPAIVDLVADPRTGIGRRNKFLPNTAEIAADCDKISAKIAADYANIAFQKRRAATPKYIPVVITDPNLFVPSDVKGYDEMVALTAGEVEDRYRYEKGHLCLDGAKRDGIWIPANWWFERGHAKHFGTFLKEVSDRILKRAGVEPMGPTPELLETLKRQNEGLRP